MRKVLFVTLLGFILFINSPLSSLVAYEIPKVLATFQGEIAPTQLREGEQVRVIIKAKVTKGWHIYSIFPSKSEDAPPPSKLVWKKNNLTKQGPVYETNPIIKNDPVIGLILSYHENQPRFYQNFKVPKNLSLGKHKLVGEFHFQVCSDKLCTPPKKKIIRIPFEKITGVARSEFLVMNRVIDELPSQKVNANSLQNALSGGVWSFIGLAIVMGAFAWLTPCVFPMIPITVSFFSSQSKGSQKGMLGLSIIFSLGIILTYTGTGLLLAIFMGASKAAQLASHPVTNILIAIIFTVFAFSLMGLFEIKPPSGLVHIADKKSNQLGGVVGVLLMGMTFTLTAFTCTVQFVGTLLIAAARGEWLWPVIGMLVFSTVFAFPFFLLSLFPQFIQKFRSKSGSWMVQVKFILGIIELMAVFKFLSNADMILELGILTREVMLGVWAFLSLIIVVILLGVIRLPIVGYVPRKPLHWVFAFLFLGITGYFSFGVAGRTLDSWTESYLPISLNQGKQIVAGKDLYNVDLVHQLSWKNDLEKALILAKKEQKPVFIDFTGYTCVNCRWMEKNIFAEKKIYQSLKNDFILVQLYTDGGKNYQKNQKLQIDKFSTFALPFYAILSPHNQILAQISGIQSTKDFSQFLEKGKIKLQAILKTRKIKTQS